MNLSLLPNVALRRRRCGRRADHQAAEQVFEVEAAVEPVGECTEVGFSVFGELEGLVCTVDHCLEVAEYGVDPGELGQLARLARADNYVGMSAARVDDADKAVEAVAANVAPGQQFELVYGMSDSDRPFARCLEYYPDDEYSDD